MNDLNSLLDNVSEQPAISASEKPKEKPISKSERVRLYMKQHPGVRNKDIVSALSHHGVTSADVGNVKSQIKRKEEKKQAAAAKSKPTADDAPAKPQPDPTLDATIGLDVLDVGLDLVKKAGGMNEAQHVLNVIRRIRSS